MSLSDAPGPARAVLPLFPASATSGAHNDESRRGLRDRFLRAGPEALDDRELLELLLSPCHSAADAAALARTLLETFASSSTTARR